MGVTTELTQTTIMIMMRTLILTILIVIPSMGGQIWDRRTINIEGNITKEKDEDESYNIQCKMKYIFNTKIFFDIKTYFRQPI